MLLHAFLKLCSCIKYYVNEEMITYIQKQRFVYKTLLQNKDLLTDNESPPTYNT